MLHDGRHILAIQRPQQQVPRRAGEPRLVQQGRRQPRQGQVEAHAGQAQGGQCLRRDQHHLRIRRKAVAADQLDAGLRHLAVRCDLAAAHAQALAGVAQPQRARQRRRRRVVAMRATCGVMSDRTPIIRWESGSMMPEDLVRGGRRRSRRAARPRIRSAAA